MSIGAALAGSSALHLPHLPAGASRAVGIRFAAPHALHVLIMAINVATLVDRVNRCKLSP